MSRLGEYGDGIMLSYAARLYERPIIIMSDGPPITFDVPAFSTAAPMRLGYIAVGNSSEKNHYVSIPCPLTSAGTFFASSHTMIITDKHTIMQTYSANIVFLIFIVIAS